MVKNILKKFAVEFLNCLYPEGITCLNCGDELKDKGFLCEKCKNNLKVIKYACEKCGNPVNSQTKICDDCKGKDRFFDLAISPYEYNKTAQNLVYKFKYNGERFISTFFATSLVDKFLSANIKGIDYVTCVPLNKSRELERGFNQAEVVCREFVSVLKQNGVELNERYDLIERIKNTATQTKLTKSERKKNLAGAFKLICSKKEIKNKTILVIDDIFTTGATMEAVVKVFKKAGVSKVYCLTVFHTNINRT